MQTKKMQKQVNRPAPYLTRDEFNALQPGDVILATWTGEKIEVHSNVKGAPQTLDKTSQPVGIVWSAYFRRLPK